MKKILILLLSTITVLGIGIILLYNSNKFNNTEIVQNSNQDLEEQTMNYKKYLMDNYDIQESDLKDIDLVKFFEDYEFDKLDYTKEEVQEILEDQGEYYYDDGSTEIYSILSKEGQENIEVNKLSKIGMHFNIGTLNTDYVFDLINNCYYVDDATKVNLTPSQKENLLDSIKANEVSSWKGYYKGEEPITTGNISWKIVLESDTGKIRSASGFTGDGSNLPDGFNQFYDDIQNIVE